MTATTRVCPNCGVSFDDMVRFCPTDSAELLDVRDAGDALVGQIIADRYRILTLLGEGGMGRVYLAEQIQVRRSCALKIIHPRLAQDPDAVMRFRREARNASRINHPNVAATYDCGETIDGLLYLAMEYVAGESLRALLKRAGPLDVTRAVALATQVASGLVPAHQLGLVHRDLKPDNILITQDAEGRDCVKIVDFGIAKIQAGDAQNVTRTGLLVGTPAYMSPEQLLGQAIDTRSDLYSLGCVLFEMLTGKPPHAGESLDLLVRRRLAEPAPRVTRARPDVPRELDAVVATALADVPSERYPTAIELREALHEAVRSRAAASHTRWRTIALIVLAIGLGGGAVYVVAAVTRTSPRPAAPTVAVRAPAPVAAPAPAVVPTVRAGADSAARVDSALVRRVNDALAIARVDRDNGRYLDSDRRLRDALAMIEKYATDHPTEANALNRRAAIEAAIEAAIQRGARACAAEAALDAARGRAAPACPR